jgi:hypothetical protein
MPSLRKISSKVANELAVPVADQKPHPLEQAREAEVTGLLRHPGAARIGGAAREMDATAAEFDVGSAGGASAGVCPILCVGVV